MASIPCAAYQASHIHAHLRRQNMRARHNSSNSTDSVSSDPVPLTTPLHITPTLQAPPTPPMTMRNRMDRVSQWVGDNYKKIRQPTGTKGLGIPISGLALPENTLNTVNTMPIDGAAVSNQSSVIKPDT